MYITVVMLKFLSILFTVLSGGFGQLTTGIGGNRPDFNTFCFLDFVQVSAQQDLFTG